MTRGATSINPSLSFSRMVVQRLVWAGVFATAATGGGRSTSSLPLPEANF
jgi:hypothetical protein